MKLRDLSVGDPCRVRVVDLLLPSAGWEIPPDPNATAFVTIQFWNADGRTACVRATYGDLTITLDQPVSTEVQPCA